MSTNSTIVVSRPASTPFMPAVLHTTWASRPAAGTAGRIHYPTDGYYPSIDTGSSWVTQTVPGFDNVNPPAAGTFTSVNATGATLVADGDGLLATYMGLNTTTETIAAFVVALPSAPYTFTVGIEFLYFYPNVWSYGGLILTDGTSNPKAIAYRYNIGQTAAEPGHPYVAIAKYNSLTNGFSAAYYQNSCGPPFINGKCFLRIYDNNSNRYFQVSADGRTWATITSNSRTDFLTATYAGIQLGQGVNASAVTLERVQAKIFHWSLG